MVRIVNVWALIADEDVSRCSANSEESGMIFAAYIPMPRVSVVDRKVLHVSFPLAGQAQPAFGGYGETPRLKLLLGGLFRFVIVHPSLT